MVRSPLMAANATFALNAALCFFRVCFMSCSRAISAFWGQGSTLTTCLIFGVHLIGRDGAGRFKRVVLCPTVTVTASSDVERARTLHKPAHEKCFIANSVNFPVEVEPEIVVG